MKNAILVLICFAIAACSAEEITVSDEAIIKAIEKSDDFDKNSSAFITGSKKVISNGSCSLDEMTEQGGWLKSVTNYKNESVYFIYCGGLHRSNRIYLNTDSGDIFR